jgi:hypothetical protein
MCVLQVAGVLLGTMRFQFEEAKKMLQPHIDEATAERVKALSEAKSLYDANVKV